MNYAGTGMKMLDEPPCSPDQGCLAWLLGNASLGRLWMTAMIRGSKVAAIIACFAREVDEIEGIVAKRDFLVVDDHFDRTISQPTLHRRNVGGALFLRAEETPVIGPRLQNHDVGSGRYIAINTFEHACGGVEWHAGIDDLRIDPFGFQQCL